MKQFLTALGGGILGAIMVLVVQTGGINFIKPAYAELITPSFLNCYLKKMEDVHVKRSGVYLTHYCKDK